MSHTDDPWIDPSKRAADQLDAIMRAEFSNGDIEKKEVYTYESEGESISVSEETIKIDEARTEAPVLHATNREKVRLLVITRDDTVLTEGSLAYRHLVDLSAYFLELHIIVLNEASLVGKSAASIMRPAQNVWVYPTNSTAWWRRSYDAYKVGEEQLVFSGGFRADVIVAEDLFEAGIAGRFLSKKYNRPLQLHIHEDFFDEEYRESLEHPVLYEWSYEYLLKHANSVRTKTEFQRHAVISEFPKLESATEILPNYYNLTAWRDVVPSVNLHERYPQFKFIILHVSSMHTLSHSDTVIAGAAKILRRYPTLGLVILGNGPLRHMLERQVIALGLEKQVEFEPTTPEVLSYMKTANVLVHLSEDGSEDDIVLQAAVSKLPIITNKDGIGGTLFTDGESACLCASDDSACIADGINRYLNENQDRARFGRNASEAVFDRIEQDYGAYLRSYAESVERCMVSKG